MAYLHQLYEPGEENVTMAFQVKGQGHCNHYILRRVSCSVDSFLYTYIISHGGQNVTLAFKVKVHSAKYADQYILEASVARC